MREIKKYYLYIIDRNLHDTGGNCYNEVTEEFVTRSEKKIKNKVAEIKRKYPTTYKEKLTIVYGYNINIEDLIRE